MDPRSEIEIRERLTRTESDTQRLGDQQATNTSWINRLSIRIQHLEGNIPHMHSIKGQVAKLEEHSKITRRERERRQMIREWITHAVTAVIGLAILMGWIGKDTGEYLQKIAGF